MSAIFLPRRWRHQPQGAVEVDWRHPLTRGLCAVATDNGGPRAVELVTGAPNTYGGFGLTGATRRSTPDGFGYTFNGGSYSDTFTFPRVRDYGNQLTVFAVVRPITATADGRVVNPSSSSYPTHGKISVTNNLPKLECNGDVTITADAALTAGARAVLIGTNDRMTPQQRLFINGRQQSATGASSAQKTYDIGTLRYGDYGDRNLAIFLSGVFVRLLSDDEIRAFSENPWQIFRAPSHRIFFDLGAAKRIPTLSLPGVIDVTATSARPKVTLTF